MDMTKFSAKTDVGYERVLGQLMGWISKIEDATGIQSMKDVLTDKEINDLRSRHRSVH